MAHSAYEPRCLSADRETWIPLQKLQRLYGVSFEKARAAAREGGTLNSRIPLELYMSFIGDARVRLVVSENENSLCLGSREPALNSVAA